MRTKTRRLAVGGVFAGLALTVMLCGGILPLATFAAPALAGIFLVPVAEEAGRGYGLTAFAAVALLSLLFVPDRELSLIFVFFLGWYPLVKSSLDKLRSGVIQWLLKVLLFNGCVVSMYAMALYLFRLQALVAEFSGAGIWYGAALLLLGNVTFVVYDKALASMHILYRYRLRPMIMADRDH